MAVHVPLSLEARAEACLLMFSETNLLCPCIDNKIYFRIPKVHTMIPRTQQNEVITEGGFLVDISVFCSKW